jgi:hypothetical protein
MISTHKGEATEATYSPTDGTEFLRTDSCASSQVVLYFCAK